MYKPISVSEFEKGDIIDVDGLGTRKILGFDSMYLVLGDSIWGNYPLTGTNTIIVNNEKRTLMI